MDVDDLLRGGREQDYVLVEQMILSDQIEAARLQELLRAHPRFEAWLEKRAAARRPRK